MTAKKFLIYRLISTAMIGLIVAISITMGNYILPIVTILTMMIVLHALKRQVKEVLEDERDYEIAGKAARYTLTIFSAISGVIIIILFALRGQAPVSETVGVTLAYSICALLLVYSAIFKYFQNRGK
jgi:uncharacterized membrane protein